MIRSAISLSFVQLLDTHELTSRLRHRGLQDRNGKVGLISGTWRVGAAGERLTE